VGATCSGTKYRDTAPMRLHGGCGWIDNRRRINGNIWLWPRIRCSWMEFQGRARVGAAETFGLRHGGAPTINWQLNYHDRQEEQSTRRGWCNVVVGFF